VMHRFWISLIESRFLSTVHATLYARCIVSVDELTYHNLCERVRLYSFQHFCCALSASRTGSATTFIRCQSGCLEHREHDGSNFLSSLCDTHSCRPAKLLAESYGNSAEVLSSTVANAHERSSTTLVQVAVKREAFQLRTQLPVRHATSRASRNCRRYTTDMIQAIERKKEIPKQVCSKATSNLLPSAMMAAQAASTIV
jgi:hypothetical protein